MKTKLKPFDLEAALQGAKVTTREGREVTNIAYFEDITSSYKVFGVIDGQLYSFNINGNFGHNSEYCYDLFMKPQQVTKWVNIYSTNSGHLSCGGSLFDTKEKAQESCEGAIDTIQITFEV